MDERREQMTLWHPWNPTTGETHRPLYDRGAGYRLYDASGKEYLDATSGALNAICGHGRERMAAVAATQMQRLEHVDLGGADHRPALDLADALDAILPATGPWHTSFVNSGSEATELAIKIAHDYWRNVGEPRTALVSFADGYHGTTLLAKSMTELPGNTADQTIDTRITRIPFPSTGAALRESGGPELLQSFRSALESTPTAAVLVEAVLNVGGGVVLPRGFLRELRALCDESGTVLILDEVFCGLGRTGRMFGFEHDEVTPDIVTISKGLGAGFIPIAAVSAGGRVYDSYASATPPATLQYGHTTGGHAVASAVALEVLRTITTEHLVDNAAERGRQLLAQLAPLNDLNGVHDVRGLGLVVTVEFDTETLAEDVERRAWERGLIVRRQRQHVMAIPPLTIDRAGIDELTDALVRAVQDTISSAHALTDG
ncbi:aspartate aminotransferase family protein [Curtobacterium flaccumfaciens]|nr:aspartate aminotransferase family protein [Curtobacterium flaccumfaciens]